ncbi:uncharacterized protein LOC117640487 [Thrips palmi]|uniref:Uncharacterized protein LOC117640487 n=1 Tax=Thrips palmi TaxID=161013 RepID=A0A6P8YG28_THRPL|nr:uncharacterized protein LOC117640487 [Thrips palmi]
MSGLRTKTMCIFLVISTAAGKKWLHSTAGPYRCIYKRMYNCPIGEDGFEGATMYHIRPPRYNPFRPTDPQLLYGNITRTMPFNDTYWLKMSAAIWSNNQWKDNAIVYNYPEDACTLERKNDVNVYRLMYGKELSDKGPCFAQAGTLILDGEPINGTGSGSLFPQLPYGLYRARRTLGLKGSIHPIECLYTEQEVVADLL